MIGQTVYYSPLQGFVIPVKVLEVDDFPIPCVWIDVPVGWSLPIGSEVFLTLEECLRHCGRATKKSAHRRHKKVNTALKRRRRWLLSTGNQGSKELPLLGGRKVYVRT